MTWNSSADMGMTRSRSVLEGGDDEESNDLAVWALVLADAHVGQLEQLLDTHAGVAEGLDDRPFPEGGVLQERDVDDVAGRLVTQPHMSRPEVLLPTTVGLSEQASVGLALDCDCCIRARGLAGGQQFGEAGVLGLDMLGQGRQ
ncbi:MAG: hypothetical protein ACRD2W_25390 [Acidimicrobiales bacterium]